MPVLWCNGEWTEAGDLRISANDRGLQLGLGLFETMLATDGDVKFLTQHLARLQMGCRRLGWEEDLKEIPDILHEHLTRSRLTQGAARVRLALTAGAGALDYLAQRDGRLLWASAQALQIAEEEVAVDLSPWPRNENSPLAGLKCASYAENVIARDRSRRRGFQETVFLNTTGNLCEAATANLFLVKGNFLKTPPLSDGCLPGITRSWVLAWASKNGLLAQEVSLSVEDLKGCDEAFLTSATKGPVRISRFEEQGFPVDKVARQVRGTWLRACGLASVAR